MCVLCTLRSLYDASKSCDQENSNGRQYVCIDNFHGRFVVRINPLRFQCNSCIIFSHTSRCNARYLYRTCKDVCSVVCLLLPDEDSSSCELLPPLHHRNSTELALHYDSISFGKRLASLTSAARPECSRATVFQYLYERPNFYETAAIKAPSSSSVPPVQKRALPSSSKSSAVLCEREPNIPPSHLGFWSRRCYHLVASVH